VTLVPIGRIRSTLRSLAEAPKQGREGAPDAWIDVDAAYSSALLGLNAGDEVIVLTWLDRADRAVLQVHPRGDPRNAIAGVFATRSPHRPNPIGLHRVRIREIADRQLLVGPLEAIDGTPVVDMKAVLNSDEA
jgi:tRNA-Thr(GGU) m(6)t(6)A37 methyltransferase TsaA